MTTSDLWHGAGVPISWVRSRVDSSSLAVTGSGSTITDSSGSELLDLRSGLWNTVAGYTCQSVRSAVAEQLDTLPSGTTIGYEFPPSVSIAYASKLLDHIGRDEAAMVRLYQTGSQAVEGAVLLSRYLRYLNNEPDRQLVVSFLGCYHGLGGVAGAVTGEPAIAELLGGLVPNIRHIALPGRSRGMSVAEQIIRSLEEIGVARISALVIEPILGSTLYEFPSQDLRDIGAWLRSAGVHFIVDEIATGFYRTGPFTVSTDAQVPFDLLLLGKGISAGFVPLSAMIVAPTVRDVLVERDAAFPHGSTGDGNPLAAACATATLEEVTSRKFQRAAAAARSALDEILEDLEAALAPTIAIRGRGMMRGIVLQPAGAQAELSYSQQHLVADILEEYGLLVSVEGDLIHLMPPLNIDKHDLNLLRHRLSGALTTIQSRLQQSGVGNDKEVAM